ncbi:hypothetical protein COLO4_36146 [Corchorus olitorius]|uniref:HTH myb-type domain-containing protein n=1 Tax=Corchorus olitorius TaxID=93759 RepID=A0A1R3GAV4_9ROSI|nr:hypothetical protein COLO4_36146 [Corchorus olitorius]
MESWQQKQRRLIISHANAITTPFEQLASAFSQTGDQSYKKLIDFPAAESVVDDEAIPQAIPININQAQDTLLSVVNPNLRRNNQNQCHRFNFNEKYSNAKSYWSQQGSLLSLDHTKLLAEATRRNSKVSIFSATTEEDSSRSCGSRVSSVSSQGKPSSTKTRLKWTADLHEKFVNCVNLLGGAEKATPRAILKLMKANGLTLLHVKSHLQKYRYAKGITESTQEKTDNLPIVDDELPMLYLKSGLQVKEILKMQLEVQRHLCEQLEAFRVHGEIEEGAVIYDKATGKSRGYGFITYKHMESAQTALRAPSKLIDGRLAVCNLACEGLSGASTTPDLAQRKLYIGGLAPDVSSEVLLNYFGRHGEIEEGSVAYDKDTNESRCIPSPSLWIGFGFVTYKTVEAAKKAIDDPQKILGGRTIIVKLADTHKSKPVQTPLPAAGVVPIALPMPPAYPQPGKAHPHVAPAGYTYPQAVAPYPTASSYASPPAAPAPYPTQPPIPYAPLAAKKDPPGMPPTTPMGMGGYPYYIGKQ